ncbi:MAG TPA: (2Fe-2S)-binding protein [Caulobacteraceae bacterium]|nr:(2Fe-2S)-binding protein [Caulobacteraceae bacterium]
MKVSLTVNGAARTLEVPANTLLIELIRDHLGLTGAHVGCDTSQCGACTVRMDGRAVKACTVLAGQAEGAEVVTIEGVGGPGALHPMQAAFQDHHALQCGFCTPGMIISAIDLVEAGLASDEAAVRAALSGNLCRCTGYHNIIAAVLDAARSMRGPER